LTVIGRGPSFRQAIDIAYGAVSLVKFAGMQYRSDIGRKAIAATIRGAS
jgi:phosphoribosylamine--glycine ligase